MTTERSDESQQPPNEPVVDAADEQEGPEFSEDNKPGVGDFLKAANEARKNLKDLKP